MKDVKLTMRDDVNYKNNLKLKKKMQFDNYKKKAFPSFDPGRIDLCKLSPNH